MGFVKWFLDPLKPADKSKSIREEALAQMRAARERIGDDEIQKMAASLRGFEDLLPADHHAACT